jgi:hypothetical protein
MNSATELITSPYVDPGVDSQHISIGNPMPKVDLNPMPESTLSPSQGLRIWPLNNHHPLSLLAFFFLTMYWTESVSISEIPVHELPEPQDQAQLNFNYKNSYSSSKISNCFIYSC